MMIMIMISTMLVVNEDDGKTSTMTVNQIYWCWNLKVGITQMKGTLVQYDIIFCH